MRLCQAAGEAREEPLTKKEVAVRTRCAVLLAWLAAALAAVVLAPAAAGAASTPASGSAYSWAQPWAAHVVAVGHWTQPPANVPIGGPATAFVPASSYAWVQPWEINGAAPSDVGRWTQLQPSIPAG